VDHDGIATGRGGSVREISASDPEPTLQGKVFIGYHNGAELGILSDSSQPPESTELDVPLQPVWELLANDQRIHDFATLNRVPVKSLFVFPNQAQRT